MKRQQHVSSDNQLVVLKQRCACVYLRRWVSTSTLGRSAAIERLRAENAELKDELLMESKFSVAPTNPVLTATIDQLEQEAHALTNKVVTALLLMWALVATHTRSPSPSIDTVRLC